MKNLKKILFVMGIILGICTVAKAQMWKPEDRAKTLQKALKLDDKQTSKITGYYSDLQKNMIEVIRSGAKEGAQEPLIAETKAKIKAVLTKKQNTEYEKWLEEQAKKDDSPKK